MLATERRRKAWAKKTSRQLRQAQHLTSHHTAPIEPAEDTTQRRATAVPQVHVSPREQYVEHRIRPAMLSICLREPLLRDRRPVVTLDGAVSYIDWCSDWLTARAECGPAMEDETQRLMDQLADRWIEQHPAAQHEFERVRKQLEALNAREPTSREPSAEYVEAELKLYHLTGCWGLRLTGPELLGLLTEVECYLWAMDNACPDFAQTST